MNRGPTISVIIPTWNRASTVVAAIESAIDQNPEPLEVLVCDDGSTDDTEQRVRQMLDHRIRWLPGGHSGRPAVARNRGIAAARGEWLAFLDSDDQWLPGKLAAQFDRLRQSGSLASSTNAWRVVSGIRQDAPLLAEPAQAAGFPKLLTGNIIVCSSAIIHRSLLSVVEGFPETTLLRVPEDYGLWLRVGVLTNFEYLSEPWVLYRDEPAASVRADGLDGPAQRAEVLVDFLAWCRRHPSVRTWRAAVAARRYRYDQKLWRPDEVPIIERLRRHLAKAWHRWR